MYYFWTRYRYCTYLHFLFTSLQTIQIEYGNDEIVIKEEGYNLEEVIQLDEVKEIEYIENDVLLYDSTKVRGPIKPHKKNT